MKRFYKIFFFFPVPLLAWLPVLRAQDSLPAPAGNMLTPQQAIEYAVAHNYDLIISKNNVEIGSLNNSWAAAGALPAISATANKTFGVNNLEQKLSNGTVTRKNGNSTQNLAAGVAVNWRIFDGLKMFATKKKLEELERTGEYNFKKSLNETIFNVITSYYNIVTLNEQKEATLEQIRLYTDRYTLAQRRFEIGTGAKYEVLEAEVDLNEQRSALLSLQHSLAVAKSSLSNLIGKENDTSFAVIDTIMVNSLPSISEVQTKIDSQNPDILLANSQLYILAQQKKEVNAARLPTVDLNGFYNFNRNSSGAGFTLFNQTYGPSGSVGISIPIFNGMIVKKQLAVNDIQIKNQQIALTQTRKNIETALTNAYINYNSALRIIELEKNNLLLATENILIATERYKKLNITSVELRQIQISYNAAKNRLYNALYQAKEAETTVALLSGDIAGL